MSAFSANGEMQQGVLKVVVSNNGGHSVDTLADMCVEKLVYVSQDAPAPIRAQAEAYKERIRAIVRGYLLQAKKSERTTIAAKLREAGHDAAAGIIGAL